jgi:Protein of unknown function with PCYCGC motif
MFTRVVWCLALSVIMLAIVDARRAEPGRSDAQTTSGDRRYAAVERRLEGRRLPPDARESTLFRDVYRFVGSHLDLMTQVRCYCGCDTLGHRSAAACFVEHLDDAKRATWSAHGAGCGMCIGIARDAMRLQRQNATVAEIRRHVETKYGPRTP